MGQKHTENTKENLELNGKNKNTELKGPLALRIARIFLIVLFMFFCAGLSSSILLLGKIFAFVTVLFVVLTTLLVKWLSKRCFPNHGEQAVNGYTIVIGIVSILYLTLFFSMESSVDDALWGFIMSGGVLLVGIGGLWMLLHSKRFIWLEYVIVGGGVVILYLPITIPQMQTLRGEAWSQEHKVTFRTLIQEAENKKLCNVNILHDVVMHKIDFTKVPVADEGSIIVLVAKNVTGAGSNLEISPVFGQLCEQLRAESPSDVKILLIHGEPGPFRGSTVQSQDLVSPILVFSWPDGTIEESGRLIVGDIGWGTSLGEAYHRIATMINQNLAVLPEEN